MNILEGYLSISLLLSLSKYSAFCMLGVIVFVQFVQYPSFLSIAPERFSEFHQTHSNWMSVLVGPVMVLELLAGICLVLMSPDQTFSRHAWINLVLVLLTWLCTFFISVPIHNRLAKFPIQEDIQKLIQTNWLRTFLWTVKALFLSLFL